MVTTNSTSLNKGTLSKTTKVTVQPSTGNITCGTVNGIDITILAKSSDVYTKTEVDNAITTAISAITDGDEVSY